ncbi:MAG: DUF1565 domain-containing protein [Deltaproteobacteria bacterium]|nr:DUF1565 domain-containing protein [Deltaproteobacteria bacterium]
MRRPGDGDDDAMVDSDDDTATDDDSADNLDDDAFDDDTVDDDTADAETEPYEFAPPPSDAVGVFVATTGDDTNPGTMAEPKRTFDAGVLLAEADGRSVFIAEGDYTRSKRPVYPCTVDMKPSVGQELFQNESFG